jgi:hypothetical protein
MSSRFDFALGTPMINVTISPLAEVRRLGHAMEAQLRAAGARVEVKRLPDFR